MTDRFVTVPDSLALPAAVKVPVVRLVGPTGAAATPADLGAATAAQGAKADASDVDQITLTGDLVLTIPEGHPAGQVYRCAITQGGAGGYTVTYDGAPVTVDLAAGASTTVELHPVGAGYAVRYPVTDLDAQVSALAEDGGSTLGASLSSTYVQSAQVSRVIASSDPDTPLQIGDLLLVYAEETWATVFASGLSEVARPWVDASWEEVAGDPTSLGGLVLRKPTTGDIGRRFLALTAVPSAVDVEVVARVRSAANLTGLIHTAVVLRGSGGPATEQGIYVGLYNSGIYVAEWVAGVSAKLGADLPFTWGAGAWYWLRAQVIGTTVRARAWADGSPEPVDWAGVRTTTVTTPGFVGVLASSAAQQDFDMVGVALDGATAPTEMP